MQFDNVLGQEPEGDLLVFQINDVNLKIPPSSIQVQKEDLTYSWRTLRSRSATKIPTGHGALSANCTPSFLDSQMLEMHRLITEIRQSPFVFIENRYLRESIVPDWTLTQNMAFVVDSFFIQRMPGTIDVWQMNLNLGWFNYSPFSPNFLFREEWETNWIKDSNNTDQRKVSIGWTYNGIQRSPRPSITDTRKQGEANLTWDATLDSIKSQMNKNIWDLIKLQRGAESDLNPLPGNMSPSAPVNSPSNSRIYVRFMNYVQRDSLIDGFGFDFESELLKNGMAPECVNNYFSVGFSPSKERVTIPLHEAPPAYEGLANIAAWEITKRACIDKMLSYDNKISFIFQNYATIDFPTEWNRALAKLKKVAVEPAKTYSQSPNSMALVSSASEGITSNGSTGTVSDPAKGKTYTYLSDLPTMSDLFSILSNKNGERVAFDSLRVTSPFKYRSLPGESSRIHWGTDFSLHPGQENTLCKVHPVRPGVVRKVVTYDTDTSGGWKVVIRNGASDTIRKFTIEDFEDFKVTVETTFGGQKEVGGSINRPLIKGFAVKPGYWLRSKIDRAGVSKIFFYDMNDAGQRVEISHEGPGYNGDLSCYYHLHKINVKVGDRVGYDTVLGTIGGTGPLSAEVFGVAFGPLQTNVGRLSFNEVDDLSPDTMKTGWQRATHLHFEYWCKKENASAMSPKGETKESRHEYYAVAFDQVLRNRNSELRSRTRVENSNSNAEDFLTPEQVTQAIKDSYPDSNQPDIDQAAIEKYTRIMNQLIADGWNHYEGSLSVPNVWYRTSALSFLHSKNLEVGRIDLEELNDDNVILTGVGGSVSTICSRIPILGHEYPTTQYLGSIEPSYSFEFAFLDDAFNLQGIPEGGAMLESMRAVLQKNGRIYREVKDSWCLATDTLVTRLLGSFRETDAAFIEPKGGDATRQLYLKKRTAIERMEGGTIEGSPGVSYALLEVSETNPYEEEQIKFTSSSKIDMESAREAVLTKLWNYEVDQQYKKFFPLIARSKELNPEFTNPASPDFGKLIMGADEVKTFLKSLDPSVAKILGVDQTGFEAFFASGGNVSSPDPRLLELFSVYEVPSDNNLISAISEPKYLYDFTKLIATADFSISSASRALDDLIVSQIALNEWVVSASTLLAEHETEISEGQNVIYDSKGFTREEAKKLFYGLPIVPSMWRSWQKYHETVAVAFSDLSIGLVQNVLSSSRSSRKGINVLHSNSNWIEFSNLSGDRVFSQIEERINSVDFTSPAVWQALAINGLSITSSLGAEAFETIADSVASSLNARRWVVSLLTSASNDDSPVTFDKLIGGSGVGGAGLDSSIYGGIDSAENNIVRFYPALIKTNTSKADMLKQTASSILPDIVKAGLLGSISSTLGEESTVRQNELVTYLDNLKINIRSCGYWTYVAEGFTGGGIPRFKTTPDTLEEARKQLFYQDSEYLKEQVMGVEPRGYKVGSFLFNGLSATLPFTQDALNPLLKDSSAEGMIKGLKPWGSPFIWSSTRENEEAKAVLIKAGLAQLADTILNSPELLVALGLDNLVGLIESDKSMVGAEAYPDMLLPFHPYYGDNRNTHPDFYFWNMYEDSSAFSIETMQEITKIVEDIVQNSYDSMQAMQSGFYNKPNIPLSNAVITPVKLNAEGTDGASENPNSSGRTLMPFFEPDSYNQNKDTGGMDFRTDLWEKSNGDKELFEAIYNPAPVGLSLSVIDNKEYPVRNVQAAKDLEEKLKNDLRSINKMLGTKEGTTLTEFENKISLLGDTNSTAYESIGLKTHLFDSASLKKLAKDSTQDIYSQNYSMKKAFPTFKLYFVEEDEIENRLLSYDDFFSYNGVKDFSVVISRKNSADVAVISLQNVSGSLDGTKRDAISDVDYFTTPLVNKDVKAEDINTSNEQKFDAVLLRPGMNVQLRVGYSNDPRNLEVLISGRVVDITWNKSGDLSEIMVQGFGAELEQVLRGTATDDDKDIYFSTHQLLGSLMLSPELVHFGRWEIGQEFQIGEAKDSRIDFTDYARPGLSSIFSLTQTLADFFMENIGFSIFLFSAVSLFNILPVSGVLSKSAKPGIASGIYGIVDNATSVSTSRSRQIIKNIVTSAVNKVKNTKVGVYATSATRSSIDALSQRASMFSMSSSNAWRPVVGEIIESRNIEKAVLQKGIDGLVESVGGEAQLVQLLRERVMLKLAALLDEQVVKGSLLAEDTISIAEKFDKSFDQIINAETLKNYQSIDELVSSLAKTTSVVRNRIFAAKLFGKIDYRILETPLDVFKAESDFTAAKAAEEIIQIGSRGVGGYLKAMRATGIVALAIPFQTTGLGVAWYFLRDSILEVRNKFLRAYETTKVSFMLSPQDDNIFAPHPKDYMDLKKRSLPEKVKLAAARGIGNVVGDTSTGIMFARWVDSERNIFDKRVLPRACKYVLDNSTIWDVFNEMSLRHPGWVYSPRPYGTSFRYTMFFGVPSQRYWSKPASKEFIRRMNKLDSAIKILSAGNDLSPAVINDLYPKWREDNQYINLTENEAKSMVQAQVLQEYLRGLDLRFTPFRKHHKISSDRDLVWNGIMSSENAANNAVAVTYFSEDANIDLDENPIATEVFKAHSRIPEHMVRVMPLRPYRGCRGQAMAVRYAMGALMDAMKDIYRGEILVVGNSKIRPYDICILMDEYNDITGPIEVEQVVHMFSHERGFLTEIKPSAVVFANEISSWPLIEAAKMTSLAVKQIEDQVGEMARFGVLNYALRAEGAIPYTVSENEVAHLKNKFNSNLSLQKVVAGVIPGIMDNASLMNEFEEFDKAIKEVVDMANDTAKISLVSATPLSGIPALAFRENILFAKKSFIKPPTALGMVQTLLLFAQASREDAIVIVPLLKSGRPIVSNLGLQDPSLAWTSIRGQLRRLVDDTISGTAEMASLLSTYGDSFWKHVLDTDFSEASQGVGGPFQ